MTVIIAEKLFIDKATGEICIRIINHCVIRQFGGYGYKGSLKSVLGAGKVDRIPRNPDFIAEEQTQPNQAVLYRLNGDNNPLHIDPKVAKKVKFDRPILHGLCSFGLTGRALYDKYGNNDPSSLKKFAARFTSHVYPGETLIVEMWKEGNGKVIFETKTKERNLTVMKGYAQFEQTAKI